MLYFLFTDYCCILCKSCNSLSKKRKSIATVLWVLGEWSRAIEIRIKGNRRYAVMCALKSLELNITIMSFQSINCHMLQVNTNIKYHYRQTACQERNQHCACFPSFLSHLKLKCIVSVYTKQRLSYF